MRRRQTLTGWRGGVKSPAAPALTEAEKLAAPALTEAEKLAAHLQEHQRIETGEHPDVKTLGEGIDAHYCEP
jgi:hypothetical protein